MNRKFRLSETTEEICKKFIRSNYNLSFGNINDDGSVDDLTTNDNQDRNKILATVAATKNLIL